VYSESGVLADVRKRLAGRGYAPPRRHNGEIHTFAFVPDIGWHRLLLPDLHELGPVTVFDYCALGYTWEEFAKSDAGADQRLHEMSDRFVEAVQRAHASRPVDWVFVYASGTDICPLAIERITADVGVPVVNMCLDDKQSWVGEQIGDHRRGQIDLAPVFDLSWTSARVACEWYLVEDGRPLYLPEGFDAQTCQALDVQQDIPVSFIGAAYGFRRSVIADLVRYGVPVQTFGRGWANGELPAEQHLAVISRSRINLGMGGIGYSEQLTNVKGRDFEIPGTGGGMYLTSFNADLAQHFVVGDEIVCYRDRDELIELARYYLAHPEEARAIARKGRERSLREHRWRHRYEKVCQVLGILA
jgi:hypothetical protein